jgi:hypothetical protein
LEGTEGRAMDRVDNDRNMSGVRRKAPNDSGFPRMGVNNVRVFGEENSSQRPVGEHVMNRGNGTDQVRLDSQ